MIEVNLTYDLQPGVAGKLYTDWARKAIVVLLKSKGIIEIRANRNLLGSPQVQIITVWESLTNWAAFAEQKSWISLMDELQDTLATNLDFRIWGPSQVAPEPLRPKKQA